MDKDLRALLNAFDGVHTDILEEVAAMLPAERSTVDQLCELAAGDVRKLQTAATWLLKRFSENGLLFNETQSSALVSVLLRESSWEARLHLLQMLDKLSLAEAQLPALWVALTAGARDSKRLIRAWSYHGIAIVAEQNSAYRGEAIAWLAEGERDHAASVRARIRRLRKSLNWLS